MKLNIARNNGFHNSLQLELFAGKSSDVNQQVTCLVLLGSELSLVGQVLRLTAAAIRSVNTRSVDNVTRRSYGLNFSNLSVISLFASDATDEVFAGESTVAKNDEASLGDLAEALAFESEGLAHEFEGLATLGEEGIGIGIGINGFHVRGESG